MLITVSLIIICNLLRIITILLLRAMPATLGHEMIGILSLIVYVALPLFFIIRLLFWRFGKPVKTIMPAKKKKVSIYITTLILLLGLTLNNHYRANFRNDAADKALELVSLPGYNSEVLKNGVLQLESENSLIYIKPSSTFYGASHTPIICWKGSGYKFKKEQLTKLGNNQIYTAELISEQETLYTAWWYDNGNYKTTKQFEWRWRMIMGEEPFRVINITSKSRKELLKEAENILHKNLFKEVRT